MSKWMIASDLHGDAACVERLLERYRESGAERLILLGDLLYHGPRNDLPTGYEPKRVIDLLNAASGELLCVRGNCDTEVDQMVLNFPILAEYAYLEADGVRLFATHGHRFNRTALPSLKAGDILLHGHTHVPAAEAFGQRNLYLNPGSVSLPKEGSPNSYLLFENGRFAFCDLFGDVYREVRIE
ncbi:MAG: phosphodiesterase [Ruminococcaceae bacterium]|nr:phosphodiesterase [Oscillospiraceae bacterium]